MIAIVIFCIVIVNNAAGLENDYSTEFTHRKCCGTNQNLVLNGTHLSCANQVLTNFQIIGPSNVNFDNCLDQCIDYVYIESKVDLVQVNCTSHNYKIVDSFEIYPKCCPINYAYDAVEHRCFKKNQPAEDFVHVLKIGLSHCPLEKSVITDYVDKSYEFDDNGTISIYNSTEKFKKGDYCLESTDNGKVIRACEPYENVCLETFDDIGKRCIRKCCQDGYLLLNRKCTAFYISGIRIEKPLQNSAGDPNFAILQSKKGKKYQADSSHDIHIDKLGIAHIGKEKKKYFAKNRSYCAETILEENGTLTQNIFIFLADTDNNSTKDHKSTIVAILLSASCIFLILTLLGYIILPEMQNLYGKTVMMYCFVTCISYVVLAFSLFNSDVNLPKHAMCPIFAYLIIFFFMASFAWLNIICFDMFMAFGTFRVKNLPNKKKEMKRFLYYHLYGYGVPVFVTSITLIVQKTKFLPSYLVPNIAVSRCFYEKEKYTYDHLIFFVLPLTAMIIINCILFIKTIRYCFKVKDEINRMRDASPNDTAKNKKMFQADKEKMAMLMKLFFIMGVTWLFEVVSSIIKFEGDVLETFETVWDYFNCLQGVFIFCIFILKRKVLESLHNKLCFKFIKRRASETSSYTMTTTLSVNARKISDTKNNLLKNDLKV